MNKKFFIEAFRFGIVGIINTLLTFFIIWLMSHVLNTSYVVANATGYIIGFLNSFLLNRSWTFKNHSDWKKSFIRFVVVFLICYGIQLGVVMILQSFTSLKETITTLLGMIVYTGINFLLNKYFTFR